MATSAVASGMEVPFGTLTTLQAGGSTLTGDGSSLDVSGARRALIYRVESSSGSAGVFTFEHSYDGGTEWATCDEVHLLSDTDTADSVTATTAGEKTSQVFKVDTHDGPCKIRARISTDWTTACPAVKACRIG